MVERLKAESHLWVYIRNWLDSSLRKLAKPTSFKKKTLNAHSNYWNSALHRFARIFYWLNHVHVCDSSITHPQIEFTSWHSLPSFSSCYIYFPTHDLVPRFVFGGKKISGKRSRLFLYTCCFAWQTRKQSSRSNSMGNNAPLVLINESLYFPYCFSRWWKRRSEVEVHKRHIQQENCAEFH